MDEIPELNYTTYDTISSGCYYIYILRCNFILTLRKQVTV